MPKELNEPNEPARETRELEYRVERLKCRRTGQWIPPAEHARCPYCFGSEADLQSGLHVRFCDYVPGRDPVHFGFPPDSAHDRDA